jgi:hypothetical protein
MREEDAIAKITTIAGFDFTAQQGNQLFAKAFVPVEKDFIERLKRCTSFLIAYLFFFSQKDIGICKETVPACSATLLQVRFCTVTETSMDDCPDIFFIHTHSERTGSEQNSSTRVIEPFLQIRSDLPA